MIVPPSLNTFLDWVTVLPLLGIKPELTVLPCTVDCPVGDCRGRLTLYHDDQGGGAWAYCNQCRFAGDIIDLAAAHWGFDVPTAIKKLVALGVRLPEERCLPTTVALHVAHHPDRRRGLTEFWEKAKRRLLVDDSKVLRTLQHKLSLRLNLDRDRWLAGPGLFVGGTTRLEAEALFHKVTHETPIPSRTHAGKKRIFLGPGWTDVLVMPLHDLPGRIKGFLFYGREGNVPQDLAVREVRYFSQRIYDKVSQFYRDIENNCGLALYEALNYADDAVIAMSDPLWALRTQANYLRDNGTPAPLVSIWSFKDQTTSPDVWNQIKAKPIFWGKPDAALFAHARHTNARVCLSGFDGMTRKAFMAIPATEWLQRVRDEAKPWDEVLERQLMLLPASEAEALMVGMGIRQPELTRYLDRAPEELRDRLAAFALRQPGRYVTVNDVPIREDAQGWHNDRTGETICNAILRIEQVVHCGTKENSYYAGKILFGGTEVPFYEKMSIVEYKTFDWMRFLLIKANAGFLEAAPKWEAAALTLATKFCTPEVVEGYTTVGWNEDHACFVFPNYSINRTGEVASGRGIMLRSRRTPALMAPEPTDLTPDNLEELTMHPAAAAFWALTTCVAANILAPVFGLEPSAIGVVGQELGVTVRAVTKALGCCEYAIPANFTQMKTDTVGEICNEHGWPIYYRPPRANLDDWTDWLNDGARKNCITPLNWYAARVLSFKAGWHVIEAGEHVASPGTWEAAPKVLPSFLCFAARQGFKLPRVGKDESFVSSVLTWLEIWFSEQGGKLPTVDAIQMIVPDDERYRKKCVGARFVDLLCRLFNDGELTMERAGFVKPGKVMALVCLPNNKGSEGRIFIPKSVVNRLLVAHDAPMLEPQTITRALVALGGDEQEYGGLPGWTVPEDYWNNRLEVWVDHYKHRLRVTE